MEVPLDEVPLFVRAGSIVPTRQPTQTVEEGPPEHLTLTAWISNGRASGRYYHETSEELTSITVVVDDGVRLDIDGMLPETTVEIRGVEQGPNRVTLDETATDSISTIDPESWSYQDGTLTIECGPIP